MGLVNLRELAATMAIYLLVLFAVMLPHIILLALISQGCP